MPRRPAALAAILVLAGCQGAIGPGPGGGPTPGPVGSSTPGPDPLAACDARFRAFDADGDGRWRIVEATTWLYTHPLVPTYGPCEGAPAPVPSPGRVVSQAAGGGVAVGSGVAEPRCPLPADAATILRRLDRDGDGGLTPAEACALVSEQVACEARFAAADRDRDGAATLAEYVAANPPVSPLPGAMANPAPPDVVFRALDRDADGKLTPAELCGLQRVPFAVPTAADLSGQWAFGTTGEPPAGPVFGECPPGSGLWLAQDGEQVTGEELVCGGPCFVPTALVGTYRAGALALTGTLPPPAEDAGREVTYVLRLDAATGHLVGTRDGEPYWAAPFVRVEGLGAPCPL